MLRDVDLKSMKEMSLEESLRLLYENMGEKDFANGQRLIAVIMDIPVGEVSTKKRLKYAIGANVHSIIMREPKGQMMQERLNHITRIVIEQTGMSKDAAQEMISLLAYATGRMEAFPRPTEERTFFASLHPVKIAGKYGYADQTNAVVIEAKYDQAKPFCCDRAKVCRRGRFGYIDRSGEEIIALNYEKAYDFSDGRAEVVLNGKQMIIDQDGNPVVEE